MFGKKPKKTTQTYKADPVVAAGANKALATGGELLDQGRTFFPGQTFAATTPNLEAGLAMQQDAANNSLGFLQPGFDLFNQTVTGNFLNPDNLMALAQPGLDRVASRVNANAMRAGGSGGSLTAEAAARGAASELGNVINAERGRQMQALSMMPALDSLQYSPGANLARIGNVQMGLDQRQIDEDMARHQFAQESPWQDLQRYSGLVTGMAPSLGGTTTKTAPSSSAGIGRLIGMAAGAAFGGPQGARIGGSLGGMLDGSGGGGGGGGSMFGNLFRDGFGSMFGGSQLPYKPTFGVETGLGSSLYT